LVVREQLPEPRVIEKWLVEINKKTFGPKFKKDAKVVEEALLNLADDVASKLAADLEANGVGSIQVNGQTYEVSKDNLTIQRGTITEHIREYTPNVIEPSFGIGRILYSLLEHSWWVREDDEARNVLSFPTVVAPFKCCLLPLSGNAAFEPLVRKYSRELRAAGVSIRTDDSMMSLVFLLLSLLISNLLKTVLSLFVIVIQLPKPVIASKTSSRFLQLLKKCHVFLFFFHLNFLNK
jgi:glycyl-tRNA synthetase